jgi:type IV pilus assembly protein PilB
MAPRVRLGELLVEAQIITREQLEEVLAVQKRDARRLGTLLTESGLVSETQVTQVLSQQLSIPWVSLYHIDFSRQLLDLVSHELAEKYCLVPIFVRRVRGVGETLYVAMDDPTHEEAKDLVSAHTGMPVRAMIAPPSDIKAAIRVYYGAGADHPSLAEAQAAIKKRGLGAGLAEPTADSAFPRPETLPDPAQTPVRDLEEENRSRAGLDVPAPDAPTTSRSAQAAPSSQRDRSGGDSTRRRAGRMLTLTLLDGTQIHLPSRAGRDEVPSSAAAPEGSLHDLIVALKALAQGTDASELLGDHVRWEAMLAALLSLLLKKHLISDREFMEEYKKT